ncbi:TRAP transporter large permease subunit [Cupriavidus taiwanensis]|uniref:Putative TRAP-type C4-dicarboxylate transport system, membrane component (Fused dctD-dctM) n=1 Tax=Cupriavidus taiwanensis TaxID=164546 RepID=A0A375H137_9BURK|nr:TRAP transporter large permease subunit [Cupriavidus taiwanensis]SOY51710.1 Putative TRAP-type C4-dicarboxylate transport system, membrane component (fused dctD-dctM) [Cupriavidus taiwanensis]SOY51989.1 Putative TRAP-type C4-dicarboxylate transport system, membrane component (fused dctD-dctM) [Cupriavidus taiwanensis]SOY84397.1 Putative TRAP-type C4-dicarboxylate transport system, membrane component (fused dctD-dctM) [Cupriavidus taiwanensis]SOZ24301.1 Putative TRAP-type C4-dicarboxylate tra
MEHTAEAIAPAPLAPSAVAACWRRVLACVVEVPAALIVLAEILLLGGGAFARYALHQPVPWTDELASILFLWLAMLGAIIALDRGSHMQLTTFIKGLSPARRGWIDALGMWLVVAFLLLLLRPAWEHLSEHLEVSTPTLEISEGYRAAAVLAGIVLMLVAAILRLLAAHWRPVVATGLMVASCGGLMWLLSPTLMTLGNVNLVIFFLLMLVACVAIGVPIAFAFGLATLCYLSLSTATPLSIIPNRMQEGMSHLILLAVPLFVFLGALIEMTGLARAMIHFLVSLIGHLRGGLQYVLLGAMYIVSGISGAKAADMAAVAPSLFPEMKRRGAKDGDLIGLLSASGAMSETIPPSIVLITVGSVTGVSITSLFIGGLMPAAVGLVMMSLVVWFQTRKEDMSGVPRLSPQAIVKALLVALPALALPVIIRTAVVEGVATATEVSTIGIFYAVVAGILVYRRFEWRRVYPMLLDTAALSGAILLIVGCATAMAWALTQSGFAQDLVSILSAVPGGKIGFLLVSALAFVILGSLLEGIPAIVLFGPLLFPIAKLVGVHEVHYAMVVIFAMGLGLFAPPFGVGFYAACAIGRVSPDVAMPRVWPHMAALFVALVLLTLVPWFSIGFL